MASYIQEMQSPTHKSVDVGGMITVTEVTAGDHEITSDADAIALARTGKKQVLERRFGLLSMTGFSCALMCTWESMLVVFLLGYQNGGPAGLVYGLLVVWAGTTSVFGVMGELGSMVPTASGQYHWVSVLAPKSAKRFLSFITGWITIAGWVAATTAGAFFAATLAQALAVINNPDYTPQGWHTTLIVWLTIVVAALLNTAGGKILPAMEIMILILHVVGFFAIIIPLLALAPKNSASDVFTTFSNMGGWPTMGLSFFVGLNGNAAAFLGTDGPVHMSEEVKNASKNVPKAMIWSLMINGLLSFGLLLAILFSAVDLGNATTNAPNGYPFVLILAEGVGSIGGSTAMSSIILILEFCSAVGALAAASRMMWSFARDNGLPASNWLKKVDSRTTVPVNAVMVVCVCCALLAMIPIGSTTAFNDVVSLVLEAFYASYLIVCVLLLYRRTKGDVADPLSPAAKTSEWVWGPWRIHGSFGVANNVFAIVYLVVLMIFSFFPPVIPVTAATMNYASLVLGAVGIFSVVYYYVSARNIYVGPVVEIDLHEL